MLNKMTQTNKTRSWCATVNNHDEDDRDALKALKYRYIVIGDEVGESGTPHLQAYVYLESGMTLSALKKKLPRAHLEPAKGDAQANRRYCVKDGIYWEDGDIPAQGKRKDLDELKEDILNGKKVDDICMDDPMVFHQYGRTLSKIEDIALRKKHRTEMTRGVWYYGPTGVGKSHRAFEGYNSDTHYVVPDDNGWWDGYTGQETVILNDFRGSIKYGELLQMVDKWPYWVNRRGREPVPFLAKLVIVTSSLRPEEVYRNMNINDTLAQLTRRFEIVKLDNIDQK